MAACALGVRSWLARRYDTDLKAFAVRLPESERPEFYLHPAVVRRNDTSARSINEWTGERTLRDEDVAEDVEPASVQPLGNYAVQITWQDGFNQVGRMCHAAWVFLVSHMGSNMHVSF
jgi:DUF971 family protein